MGNPAKRKVDIPKLLALENERSRPTQAFDTTNQAPQSEGVFGIFGGNGTRRFLIYSGASLLQDKAVGLA